MENILKVKTHAQAEYKESYLCEDHAKKKKKKKSKQWEGEKQTQVVIKRMNKNK